MKIMYIIILSAIFVFKLTLPCHAINIDSSNFKEIKSQYDSIISVNSMQIFDIVNNSLKKLSIEYKQNGYDLDTNKIERKIVPVLFAEWKNQISILKETKLYLSPYFYVYAFRHDTLLAMFEIRRDETGNFYASKFANIATPYFHQYSESIITTSDTTDEQKCEKARILKIYKRDLEQYFLFHKQCVSILKNKYCFMFDDMALLSSFFSWSSFRLITIDDNLGLQNYSLSYPSNKNDDFQKALHFNALNSSVIKYKEQKRVIDSVRESQEYSKLIKLWNEANNLIVKRDTQEIFNYFRKLKNGREKSGFKKVAQLIIDNYADLKIGIIPFLFDSTFNYKKGSKNAYFSFSEFISNIDFNSCKRYGYYIYCDKFTYAYLDYEHSPFIDTTNKNDLKYSKGFVVKAFGEEFFLDLNQRDLCMVSGSGEIEYGPDFEAKPIIEKSKIKSTTIPAIYFIENCLGEINQKSNSTLNKEYRSYILYSKYYKYKSKFIQVYQY
jgi:hypothetical protein